MRLAVIAVLFCVPVALAQPPVTGRWAGEWVTDGNGHRGPLRATVVPAGDGYDARFSGRFAKVIPFTYRQHLTTVGTDGQTMFLSADRRLPLFGTFHLLATATADRFDATFTTGKETGRFVLRR